MAVHYEQIGSAAVITIARPHRRNAIDRETASALAEAWLRFDEDDDAAVGILTGSGGTFCAGADLKAFDLEETEKMLRDYNAVHIEEQVEQEPA